LFEAQGHAVRASDLYAMGFNPLSARHNFTSVKDPEFLKLQVEEMHATEVHGFAPDVETELEKLEWCDLMIWQFPLWWFGLPAILKGWADRTLAMGRTFMDDFIRTACSKESARSFRLRRAALDPIMKREVGMVIFIRS
jgi:putative NADPH-quinone reductase